MAPSNTNPPSGMRDFLPLETLRRHHVAGVIARVFERHGFMPLETPAIENLEALLGKYGDEGDQLIFRLLHRREKLQRALAGNPTEADLADLGLRYDLTVPLARVIANQPQLPKFFRRYQIQPVWRADRPGKGRYREFVQCDIDITGSTHRIAEAEVCGAVAWALQDLGLTDFYIHINHRVLLTALLARAGIAPEAGGAALVALDKLDKIGGDGVRDELIARSISPEAANRLLTMANRPDHLSNAAELARLAEVIGPDLADGQRALAELGELQALLSVGPAAGRTRIDATLARGLSYYTGPIFEIRAPGAKGSLGGGGRYDGLIGMFCHRQVPAVGFSIGFDRLVLVMDELKLFPAHISGPQVMVCRFPEIDAVDAVRIGNHLRQAGLRVEVMLEAPKIGKQFGYAEEQGVPVVAVVGGDELAAGRVTLKHLARREQQTVDLDAAARLIEDWLRPSPDGPVAASDTGISRRHPGGNGALSPEVGDGPAT